MAVTLNRVGIATTLNQIKSAHRLCFDEKKAITRPSKGKNTHLITHLICPDDHIDWKRQVTIETTLDGVHRLPGSGDRP